ncbi:TonB-dependent receptor [Adhaeribacter aquaticus]|uniref:TonB-dependent receptor n=1 Tax=Adhaeribacter aquaticus TaxID=299567 RepID=UPI00040558AF|nr:TonB-dependent receptor [Adhaeribacter aquaticus]
MSTLKSLGLILFLAAFVATKQGLAQTLTQTIRGRVIDKESQEPLIGASVAITNLNPVKGATTDADGNFKIEHVPVGRHTLKINYIGYEDQLISELLLGSGKELVLHIGLLEAINQIKEVVITSSGSQEKGVAQNEMATLSARSISVEETKRYAASVNDPARAAQNYAGVGSTDDARNEIVVRGNSPKGILWRVEGIEVPNPTHFAEEGASGGAISILSVNMLDNSDFYTGAFPAQYGNALSGIFDIRLRRGNNEKREYALQAGLLGLDFAAEGPFKKGYRGSYLVNYRYSTLAILNKIGVNIAGDATPKFQDLSWKINLPTTKAGVFSVWGLSGYSEQNLEAVRDATKWKESWQHNDEKFNSSMLATGISHTYSFKNNAYLESVISLSGSQNTYRRDSLSSTFTPNLKYQQQFEHTALRTSLLYNQKFNARHTLRTGFIHSTIGFNLFSEGVDNEDHQLKRYVDNDGRTGLYQAYAQWKYRIAPTLTLNTGLHAIRLGLNGSTSVEPRLGLKWNFSPTQSLGAAVGIHSRHETLSVYYAQKALANGQLVYPNKNLNFTKARHYVLSYDHLVRQDLRLKVETYYQRLDHVPVYADPEIPEATLNAEAGFTTDSLVNKGKGRNYGLEFTLEKFFTNNYYFLLTNSLYNSKYTALDGIERNTRFNGNYIVNFLAGKEYKVGRQDVNLFSANIKVSTAGGNRYTPIHLERSKIEGKAIYNEAERYSLQANPYFRTDIRISYRKNKPKASYILSLDIQNVTNRLNMYNRYYDNNTQSIKTATMTGLIPILNYRVEF